MGGGGGEGVNNNNDNILSFKCMKSQRLSGFINIFEWLNLYYLTQTDSYKLMTC